MKNLISTLSFLLFMGVVAVSAQCCNGATAENSTKSKVTFADNQKSSEVKAYYFHATRRCATCNVYNKLKTFELWFRRVVAVLFIGVGTYYIFTIYF